MDYIKKFSEHEKNRTTLKMRKLQSLHRQLKAQDRTLKKIESALPQTSMGDLSLRMGNKGASTRNKIQQQSAEQEGPVMRKQDMIREKNRIEREARL